MRRFLATTAAALLLALPAAGFAADTPPATPIQHESQSPDFSACEPLEGQLFGQCVAEIAQAFRDDRAASSDADAKSEVKSETGEDAAAASGKSAEAEGRAIAGACAALSGQKFGECVSAAAQQLSESGAQGDEHASAVAAAAQQLVDTCQAKDGRAFGACVSAAAQQLGDLAGAEDSEATQAAEHGQGDAHRSANAPDPAGRGQSGR